MCPDPIGHSIRPIKKIKRTSLALWFIGLFLILAACHPAGKSIGSEMLKPGDVIDGMRLTTGTKDASSLWAFCPPVQPTGNTVVSYCNVPILPRLAIGHIVMPDADILNSLDWSEISWRFNIDDQPLDLSSFGTYEYALPVMPHKSSLIREVFMQYTDWDVVLTNLSPGEHTIQGLALIGTDNYSWVIHLTIEESDRGQGTSWVGSDIQGLSLLP